MNRMRPSPALVISLVALFVALGGTSYAAINSLPANSVGTKQLKNGAVTATKLNSSVLKGYLKYGGTLPSGKTEVGDWGFGTFKGADGGGGEGRPVISFPVPLASGLDGGHTIYVSGASAAHCSGSGHADPGYLCVYQDNALSAQPPNSMDISNPEVGTLPAGTGTNGWTIHLTPVFPAGVSEGQWQISGTYAVTAP